jgi:hypothetical protein
MCAHPPTGVVSCPPGEDSYAQTPVCALPACVTEALDWVHRVTGKVPIYERTDDHG